MISLWWLALPVLLLPIWWHRQKRERVNAAPLATARFLPRTDPQQQRVWRWVDRTLLLVRCLLLVTVIAWLADMVLAWRGDAVLIVPGTDTAWAAQQAKDAGFESAEKTVLQDADAFRWLALREREFQSDARILLVGDVRMPAVKPAMTHQIVIRSKTAAAAPDQGKVRIAIVSKRLEKWRALFAALESPERYIIAEKADGNDALVIWDVPEAPPADLRADLWWIGDETAFPELAKAPAVDGLRYADSARGRLWSHPAWPAADPDTARAQFETWQRLHHGAPTYAAPSQTIDASATAAQAPVNGALRYFMTFALLALFALERILAHAKRR